MTATPGWASKNQTIQDQVKSSKNQIQLTELAAYEERTPEVEEGRLLKMCVLLPLNTVQKPALAS